MSQAQATTGTSNALNRLKELAGENAEQFGGGSNYLQMEVDSVRGPFIHVRIDRDVKLTEDSKKPVDLHVATDENGEEIRMPAAAIFRGNAEDAELKTGDSYYVARLPDTTKKTGSKLEGKGNTMEVYVISVTKRAKKK